MNLEPSKSYVLFSSKEFIERFGLYNEWNRVMDEQGVHKITFDNWEPGQYMSDDQLIKKILERIEGYISCIIVRNEIDLYCSPLKNLSWK